MASPARTSALSPYRAAVQASLDTIETQLCGGVDPKALADRAGFSLSHYYRVFQAEVGMPLGQYILRRRLQHAIYAMAEGQTGIDAALRYGFDTYAGFYRAFRREYGCTPFAFLRRHRPTRPYRIDLFREEHPMITHKKAAEVLRAWPGFAGAPLTDLYHPAGHRHENICAVGETHFLKFGYDRAALQRANALARALADGGLCAPCPVPAADGREIVEADGVFYVLTPRLNGTPLTAEAFYAADGTAEQLGQALGRLHTALAGLELAAEEADLLQTVRSWALPAAAPVLGWSSGFCAEYLAQLEALLPALPRQLIHRDPNPGNLLRCADGWGFVDFELSERNLRLYDPIYAATAVLSESFDPAAPERPERWFEVYRGILAGYDRTAALTDAERAAAPCLLLANQLVCVAWFAGQEKYRDLLAVNKAMTLWLVQHWSELQL